MDIIQLIQNELSKLPYDRCEAILSAVESIVQEKQLEMVASAEAADLVIVERAWDDFLESGEDTVPHEEVMRKLRAVCGI